MRLNGKGGLVNFFGIRFCGWGGKICSRAVREMDVVVW